MSREILFRGKRIDNGEWVYGVPIQHYDGDWLICTNNYKCTIIPETIGQCSGLTDKNGRKIFEGDVVQCCVTWGKKGVIGTIKYGRYSDVDILDDDYECLGWYIEVKGQCVSILSPKSDGITIEVIDNIHDNPKLLEVQKIYVFR